MSACCPTLRGNWVMGALSPADAANQVFPSSKISSGAGQNQQVWDLLKSSASSESLPIPGACSSSGSSGPSNVQLAQMAGGLALTGINTAAVLSSSIMAAVGGAAILGVATMGIGAIIGLFPMIFGHHAAAVKKEQSVLCAAVPAANNYLQIIAQAVQNGQATPQDGQRALDSLLNNFESTVASIEKGSIGTGTCNAACVWTAELEAVVLQMKSEFQDQIDAANAAASAQATVAQAAAASVAAGTSQVLPASTPNTTAAAAVAPASSYASFYNQPATAAPSTSSSWLPIAAVLIGGFLLVRAL